MFRLIFLTGCLVLFQILTNCNDYAEAVISEHEVSEMFVLDEVTKELYPDAPVCEGAFPGPLSITGNVNTCQAYLISVVSESGGVCSVGGTGTGLTDRTVTLSTVQSAVFQIPSFSTTQLTATTINLHLYLQY